jgi:hypothetical protein
LVAPPLLEVHVAVWLMMALPLLAPMVKETLICPAATLSAVTFVGAAGDPTTTGSDAVDARPAPRELVAFTVHV